MDSLMRIIDSIKLNFEAFFNISPDQHYEPLLRSLLLAVAAWVCLTVFRSLFFRPTESTQLPLPPGSYGWPIIGETMRLMKGSKKPGGFVRQRMERYKTTVFKTSILGERMAAFCGPAANKFLFSNENRFVVTWWPRSTQSIFPLSIVTSHSSRKLLTSFLRPEYLRLHISTMDAFTRSHMDAEWTKKSQLKAAHLVKYYTFALACRLFANIDDPDHVSKLKDELEVVVSGVLQVPVKLPGTRYYKAMKAAEIIRKELASVIKQRRVGLMEKNVSSAQDLLSYLLVTGDDDGQFMTEGEIIDNILLLLFAGHDTTSCAMTLVMKNLGELPHIYNEVFREQREIAMSKKDGELLNWDDIQKMKYSWNVVNETLRLTPPVPAAFRNVISDISFAGFTIPKGWKIYWNSYVTHNNADYFPMPEKFDPTRFEGDGPAPYTFIPFGGGPRMCPGKEFARLQILVFLHNVVKRFRWESEVPGEKIEIHNGMPRPVQGLPIRLQPNSL
ncbi:hypothetical protein MRB53_008371 [Persea americana]|uniref:Uncharacterized protein n=1 Tax=Persea americana TaxID=3435 RepID=A0ACC2MM91_PERAE|nr:hypothetical protein MRB53_008371 [Persea americana]|eukprot:TRINITY_DN58399_c0_g1_i1.p1 TRINITY_DN58399_c0_g1~~TRINITY_DN58399_c0_g1_i1.p1  ORF type:complete len:501 (+),score=65.24 TRINITY_DN58399_c0_g1_i1:416-1918(+)